MSKSGHAPVLSVRCDTFPPSLPPVTLISFSIILASVLIEFIDYRRIRIEPSIVVDRSRGEKLVIEMDVSFPRVPCSRGYSC